MEEDLPPGYLQSLINRILNNLNIVVNNLIVKFVEDDIVLSINVKSAECYSVDQDWIRWAQFCLEERFLCHSECVSEFSCVWNFVVERYFCSNQKRHWPHFTCSLVDQERFSVCARTQE